jgi:Rieske Fe-S protein
MTDMNRRDFVAIMATTACACCLGIEQTSLAAETAAGPVDVGAVTEFAADGIVDKFVKSHRFFVVKKGTQLIAPVAVCTHKGKGLIANEGQMLCRSHGSRFESTGIVSKGPAKKSLARYGISVNAAGHVLVDTTKRFEEDKWSEAGSFVELA